MKVGKFPLIITLCCAMACSHSSGDRTDKGGANSAAPSPAAAANPPDPSPAIDRALAAVRKLATTHSFRAVMTTTGTSAEPVKTNMDIVLPDRFHIINPRYEMIVAGTDNYVKFSGGEWQKSERDQEITSFADPQKIEAYLNTATETTALGSKVIDETPVQGYQAKFNHLPSSKAHAPQQPYTVKLWVRESDGWPRLLEGASPGSGSKMTVIYYDYDARLKISPPIR